MDLRIVEHLRSQVAKAEFELLRYQYPFLKEKFTNETQNLIYIDPFSRSSLTNEDMMTKKRKEMLVDLHPDKNYNNDTTVEYIFVKESDQGKIDSLYSKWKNSNQTLQEVVREHMSDQTEKNFFSCPLENEKVSDNDIPLYLSCWKRTFWYLWEYQPHLCRIYFKTKEEVERELSFLQEENNKLRQSLEKIRHVQNQE